MKIEYPIMFRTYYVEWISQSTKCNKYVFWSAEDLARRFPPTIGEEMIRTGKRPYMTDIDITDSLGIYVSIDYIVKVLRNHSRTEYWHYKRREDVRIASEDYFRSMPVPRTGKRKWRGWGRKPRTTQENRLACDVGDEYKVPIRAKRKNLPTWYDDLPRGDWNIKNWKRYRGTQYK